MKLPNHEAGQALPTQQAGRAQAQGEAEKARAEAKVKARDATTKHLAELSDSFNPQKINDVLRSKEPTEATDATGREVNRISALGTASGSSQRLHPSMRNQLIGVLQQQLLRCWVVPVALQSSANPPVPSVHITLNRDGSLAAEPAVINHSTAPLFSLAADSASHAARRCSPLRIPAQFAPHFEEWKDLVVDFNLPSHRV
jgi:colicin import membrane protein